MDFVGQIINCRDLAGQIINCHVLTSKLAGQVRTINKQKIPTKNQQKPTPNQH
jgi:hypothetical protein